MIEIIEYEVTYSGALERAGQYAVEESDMKKSVVFRQGDVLVQRVPDRPRAGADASERGRIVLAHGEVTGHAHEVVPAERIDGELPAAQFFEEPDGTRMLFVDRHCLLTHQEHAAIALAPGCYKVVRQREYSPEEIRTVAD